MWSNFHTHTHYCDGKGTVAEYAEACRASGVSTIGFSSHAPLPFSTRWSMKQEDFSRYREEISTARATHPDLEIYIGLETDYIPGVVSPRTFAGQLDYTIGSIHFVSQFENKHWEIDNTGEVFREGLARIFQNDIRAAVTAYFTLTREMIAQSAPDILGHMDKIKINCAGTLLSEDEAWYIEQVDQTLKTAAAHGTIIEVNTRGLYKKKSDTTYPSPWILERILDLDIPVMVNSDAHHPGELTKGFSGTLSMLADIGFKQVSTLRNGTWTPVPLNDYEAS